jgi:hypothetical protein
MSAATRQTLTARLQSYAGRILKASDNNTLGTLSVPRQLIVDCAGIVADADQLRVLTILYYRLLRPESHRSVGGSSLKISTVCFGSDDIIRGTHVIMEMLLANKIAFSDANRMGSTPTIGFNNDFLAAEITLADNTLERIAELEVTLAAQQPLQSDLVMGSDMATSMAAAATADAGEAYADEEANVEEDDDEYDEDKDPVVVELAGKRKLMEEAFPTGMTYIPDEAIKRTFDQIVSICSSNVSDILREYGVASIASHYTKTRHDRVVILLSGTPGTGKTAAAYALADMLKRRLFVTSTEQLMSPYHGVFERQARRIFTEFKAISVEEANAPILLIDECEVLFARRGQDMTNNTISRSNNTVTDILLQEVETFEGILILTTNTPKALDPAFARRIDYTMHIEKPSVETQRAVWKLRLSDKIPGAADINIDAFVPAFSFTPAEITQIVHNAVRTIVSRNPTDHRLTVDDLIRECIAYRGWQLVTRPGKKAPFGFI